MPQSDPNVPVVVGIDGSDASMLALDWAATQAAAETRPLVLLTAAAVSGELPSAWLATYVVDDHQDRAQLKERARAVARRCTARVHEKHPGLDVRHEMSFEDPRDALLEIEADLVVVGTRGLGLVRRLLLGSVASEVVKHATHPTVVVRERKGSVSQGGVLVGIAGDAGDAAAINLACRVAQARSLPVTAYHSVWDVVQPSETRDVAPDAPGYDAERLPLVRAIEIAKRDHPGVEVRQVLSRGFADQRLIRASEHADLLVVGHRRKPFLNELVYGSVAPKIAEHASCSVAVVPYHAPDATSSGE